MRNRLERVFNHWTLLFFNAMIVIFVEATSMFFMRTGLIHLIAILFIVLGISRILVHYDVYDQYLRPFTYGGVLALLVSAASHVLEYVSYSFLSLPYDAIAANVVNLYLAGLLIIVFSVEYFLRRIEKELKILSPILCAGIGVCLALTVLFFFKSSLIKLTPSSGAMYGYGLAVLSVTLFGIRKLLRLRGHVRILVGFINYFVASFILISTSALMYVLSDVLEGVGIPYLQVMYISHFLFYGALSLMFLAYGKLAHLGGVYEGIEDLAKEDSKVVVREDIARLHKPSHWKDYLKVGLFAVFWVMVLGAYLWVRRGYMFDAPLSAGPLYVPNKVIAGAGLMVLGFVFLIGPLARYFDRFDFLVHYRKEMGIVGALMVASHTVISFFFVSKKFPGLEYFLGPAHLWTFIAGLAGLIVLIALIILSFSFAIRKLGDARWWFLQRWGLRLAILFSALHIIPMKWAGWQTWFIKGAPRTVELANPQMTPASLLATLFFIWVILIRVCESIFIFHSFGITTKEVSVDPILRHRGRQLVVYSFMVLLILYLMVLFRWVKF